MCKILCKLITLYNMKIRLWDCKTYGYGYIAACLQCYYSELSKLSSTPGQTIAAECFHTDIATKVWSWSTHDTRHTTQRHMSVLSLVWYHRVAPCWPPQATRAIVISFSKVCMQSLVHCTVCKPSDQQPFYIAPHCLLDICTKCHIITVVVGTWGTCLRACRCPRPPRPWARAAAARPSPPPPPCRHPAACSPPPAHNTPAAWQDLRWILKILKASSDEKEIPLHIIYITTRQAKQGTRNTAGCYFYFLYHSFVIERNKKFSSGQRKDIRGSTAKVRNYRLHWVLLPSFRVNKLFYCYLLSRYFEYFVEK